MINIQQISKAPKDHDTMITRRVENTPYIVKGIVVNKKSQKSYNIDIHMDTQEMSLDSNIKVKCTCDDFQFRWAYVLSQKGALLDPKRFRLDPPKKTNPDQIMNACKHIHAFIKNELSGKLTGFSNSNKRL